MQTCFQPHDVEYHRNGELKSYKYAFINNWNAMENKSGHTERAVFVKKVCFPSILSEKVEAMTSYTSEPVLQIL